MGTKNRFFVCYSPDSVIWGIGHSKRGAIEEGLKYLREYEEINQEHYPIDVLDAIESTFRLYERVFHRGYREIEWNISNGKASLVSK